MVPFAYPAAVSATAFMRRMAPNCSIWNTFTIRVFMSSRGQRNVAITWALVVLPSKEVGKEAGCPWIQAVRGYRKFSR